MTRAVILAAGRGTRLGEAAAGKPKCLAELAGRTLLDRQLAALESCGVTDVALVGGFESGQLVSRGHRVILNPRYAQTNMVASLFCAEDFFKGHDLVVAYGDIVYEPRVLEALLSADGPAAVVVDRGWKEYWQARFADPLADAETLKIGPDGNLRELGKKPKDYSQIEAQYIGLFKIRADRTGALAEAYRALDRKALYDGKTFDLMYMTSFLQHLIDTGWPLRAVPVEHGWLELDTTDDLALYGRLAASGGIDRFFRLRDAA